MKLLAVFFFVGLALAYAVPAPSSQEISLEDVEELESLLSSFQADEDEKSEFEEKLKKHLDEILEKVKDTLEKGKAVREDIINKMREVREKLKDLKVEISAKAKDLMEKIKEKAKDFWKRIFEKKDKESRSMKDDMKEKMKSIFERLIERVKERLEKGKSIGDGLVQKLREILEKFGAGNGGELKDKARQMREKLTDKAKEMYDKILERLGISNNPGDAGYAEGDELDEIKQRLKKSYDEILEKIKEIIENGKTVKDDVLKKAKEIREKLQDLRVEISNKAKDLIEKIKEKSKKFWKDLFDKFGNRDERALVLSADDDDVSTRLREKFEEIVKKIKDAFENNQNFRDGLEKLKEIRQRIKDLSIELGEKGKDLVKKLREKVQEYLQTFLDRFTQKRAIDFKDMLKKLRDRIKDSFDVEKIKKNIEEIFGKGNEVSEQLIQKLKDKSGKVKEKILDFIDRILENKEKRSVKEIYEKIKNYFKDLQIDLKEKFVKFGEWAKTKYEKGLEKGKDKLDNLKKLAREFINDANIMRKDVAEQAKDFFREYKDDLGVIYDEVKEKVRDILKRD